MGYGSILPRPDGVVLEVRHWRTQPRDTMTDDASYGAVRNLPDGRTGVLFERLLAHAAAEWGSAT